jgi:hypothetical protein
MGPGIERFIGKRAFEPAYSKDPHPLSHLRPQKKIEGLSL